MPKNDKIKKKYNIKLLILKIVVFVIVAFLFISFLTTKNTILIEDRHIVDSSNYNFWSLFSTNSPKLSNPLGIIGAFLSYHITRLFGHLFSLVMLAFFLTFLALKFAHLNSKKTNLIFLFAIWSVINSYLFLFYLQNHLSLYEPKYHDKLIFEHLYYFIFSLIGKGGTLLFCLISFVLSFRLLINFNPFEIFMKSIRKIIVFLKENKDVFTKDGSLHSIDDEIDRNDDTDSFKDMMNIDDDIQENPVDEIISFSPKNNLTTKLLNGIKYKKPDIDTFLYKPGKDKRIDKSKLDNEIKAVSQILTEKLAEFGIEAIVSNVNIGPIITQYELEPAPGIKVNRFTSLSDDLALALKAKSIRVQAPIPGRGLIGVEVPNKNADIIYMRDIFFSQEMNESKSILSVALGKDIAGRPIVTDLAKTPHLLIAGATGSGKSVCINTIICSILLRCTPEEVRLVMIDPKRIELSGYEGIPHLIQSVITEPEEAMNTLTWAVYEMERRYELLQELKVRDIISYNLKIEEMVKNSEAEDIDKLPYIVLILDEFADLIMTAGREIEQPIARLAQMARAIGIHIILATQRPSIKVITGVIKANFPARIAFRVSSKVDSRVILDSTGADKLLGRGDMLFLPPGKPNPERIHGAYLSDSEIEGLVDYLRTQPKPKLDIQMSKPEICSIKNFEYDDDLFPEAAKVVVLANMASVSMLQRHFKIGYARAGRLIDLLERAGVIGPHLGSKPRDVLMNREDLEELNNV